MKKTPEPEEDEREGFVSGSSLGRVLKCHGSFQLSKIFEEPPPQDYTLAGTRIADLIHRLGTGKEIPEGSDDDEIETAEFLLAKKATKFQEICEENNYDPDDFEVLHEQRFWYTHAGSPMYSGQLDTGAVHKTKPIGIVIDDKSGWMEQPPPWLNDQLLSYSLLLVHNFPQFAGKEMKVHAATNSRFWDRKTTFTFDDFNNFHADVVTTIPKVVKSKPWADGLNPGEHCRWCPARKDCPVLRWGMATFKEAYGPPEIDVKAKAEAMKVEELEAALLQARVIDHAIKALTAEADRRIKEDPDAFDFYSYKSPPPRKQVGDIGAAVAALGELGVKPNEIIECFRSDALTAGKTSKLEKLLYRKLNADPDVKITHPETFDKLTDVLELHGALEEKQGPPRLTYDPEKRTREISAKGGE